MLPRSSRGGLFAISCGGKARPRDFSLILVTLDTTRADRIGAYGSRRVPTSNLDAIARDGALFGEAISQVPLTPEESAALSALTAHSVNKQVKIMVGGKLRSEPFIRERIAGPSMEIYVTSPADAVATVRTLRGRECHQSALPRTLGLTQYPLSDVDPVLESLIRPDRCGPR